MVGFFERTILTKVARFVGRPTRAGSQYNVDVGVLLANTPGETETVYLPAQLDLCEDNVNLLSGPQYGHHVGRRDTFENRVSAVAQIVAMTIRTRISGSTTRMVLGGALSAPCSSKGYGLPRSG